MTGHEHRHGIDGPDRPGEEVEIGWSGRSSSHVIDGYGQAPGYASKPLTACGKSLSGLAGNLFGPASLATCPRCSRPAPTGQ